MNSFHIEVNFKDTNLAIGSPLSLFIFKRKPFKDNLKQVFLLQTIVWKANSENSLSNIFSVEIFDKNTKQKLEFLNFSAFALKFLLPKANNLKFHLLIEFNANSGIKLYTNGKRKVANLKDLISEPKNISVFATIWVNFV